MGEKTIVKNLGFHNSRTLPKGIRIQVSSNTDDRCLPTPNHLPDLPGATWNIMLKMHGGGYGDGMIISALNGMLGNGKE